MYGNGEYVEASLEKSLEWYSKAAEQGHARSCWKMAYLYYNGLGILSSEAKAREWLVRAVDNGFDVGVWGLEGLSWLRE